MLPYASFTCNHLGAFFPVNNLLVSSSASADRFMPNDTICRAPDYGSQGEVRLPFEENESSKVGVRFDKKIPGGIDLGGNCEVDRGFFCPGEPVCSVLLCLK